MKVLLDANFLMVPNQFGVDVFEELGFYKLFTLSSCVEELRKIARSRDKDGKAAKIALKLVESQGLEVVKTGGKGDDAIVGFASVEKCAVATNDKELIKALKKKGVKIFRLKQRKYIAEEG